MSTRLDIEIQEGSDAGFIFKVCDTRSNYIIPNSVEWFLYDSNNTAISSGALTSFSSSGSLIILSNSMTMTTSGETRSRVDRKLYVKTCYNDSELGDNSIELNIFTFTVCNNPFIP